MKDTLGRENRKIKDKQCSQCGKEFRPVRESAKYCSRPCLWKNNGGHNKKTESWWVNKRGYIEGRVWIDAYTQISVKKHRWVIEQHLGRQLLTNEDVHHINGDKQDNRIENLEVINHALHATLSNKSRQYKKGYKLKLSEEERMRRKSHMQKVRRA